jgi:hypothetical protein
LKPRRTHRASSGAPENTLLILGGVVAFLAVLALVLVVFAPRAPAPHVVEVTPPAPVPTALLRAAIRIQPVFANGTTTYQIANVGQADAQEIHVACIVTDTNAWPVLRLHAPAGGQRLTGETLASRRAMGLSLGACMNGANVGTVPAGAYFLVRYFTPDGAEHVEEALVEPAILAGAQRGFRLVDPRVPSIYYREPLLAHLRRYAPPP